MKTIQFVLNEYLVKSPLGTIMEAANALCKAADVSNATLERMRNGHHVKEKTAYHVLVKVGLNSDDAMKLALKQKRESKNG